MIVLEVNLLFGYRSYIEVNSVNINIDIAQSHIQLIISKYKMFQKLQISDNIEINFSYILSYFTVV